MKGVRYLIDDSGKKTAVVLDLAVWGELWDTLKTQQETKGQGPPSRAHVLSTLAGTWSEDDEREFLEATRDLEEIDKELWH